MFSSIKRFIASLFSRPAPARAPLRPMVDIFPSNDREFMEMFTTELSPARQQEFANRYPRTLQEYFELFPLPGPTTRAEIPPMAFHITRHSAHSGEMVPVAEPDEMPLCWLPPDRELQMKPPKRKRTLDRDDEEERSTRARY